MYVHISEIDKLEKQISRLIEAHKKLQDEHLQLQTKLLEGINQQAVLKSKNDEAAKRIHAIITRLQLASRSATG